LVTPDSRKTVRKLKVAVIGAGRLGRFHAEKIVGLPCVELVAVVDPLPASRNELAAECNTKALADHTSLLGEVDAAVIASPTRLHHRLALDFLQAGAHLLVEKPLAATLAESDELVQTARRRNLVLQVGHVERFNPALTAALPHVRSPKFIEAVRTSGFTFRSTDIGVVLDLMIHDIDVVLSMVRSPLMKVEALGVSVLGGHEDVANARLEFECGCVAALSASRVSYEALRRMQVWSPRAFAGIDFATRTTTLVRPSETLLRRQFNVEALTPEQVEYYRQHLVKEHLPREQKQFEAVDALALELQDFVDAIRTPRLPRVSGTAGRDAVAVAEQILDRIAAHAWDSAAGGPVGPLAIPQPSVVPAPHFDTSLITAPASQRAAG
jgi:predicted dehydrogenase